MQVALFGATGRVGSVLLQTLLADGHDVVALVRKPTSLQPHSHLNVIVGDAKRYEDVEKTIQRAQIVVSTLGTDQTTTLTEFTTHMIDVCSKLNVSRSVSIGTAGILNSRLEKGKLRYESIESRQTKKFAAKEHAKVFSLLSQSLLDWTIVCPTALPLGERIGTYRVEADTLPEHGRRISVYDTADFTYQVMTEHLFSKKRVGIAY